MSRRKIIKIDEKKCDGCGVCIPNCPEGALRVIDGKARLISDLFCDGLGACIGHCPQGAITIEERQAAPYDERKVMENIVTQGANVIKAHLEHLREHGEAELLRQATDFLKENGIENPLKDAHGAHRGHGLSGCPGSRMMDFRQGEAAREKRAIPKTKSRLRQWPVQIMLVPPNAPYFKDADLLIAADCVPFAYANFHEELLRGKALLVGCPKLDDIEFYREKITQILKNNSVRSVTYAHMEVPCCFGLVRAIESAIAASGKKIPFQEITVSIKGEIKG
jgi:ferredoxin